MRRSPRTRVLTASVAMVAAFALAACGGDDDDDTADTSGSLTVETVESDETVATDGTAATSGTDVTDETDGTTGSSGGGEVGAREDYVAAAVSQLQIEDEEVATCVAEALVSDDVYDQIEELDVTVEGFSDTGPAGQGITLDQGQAEAVASDVAACGDIVALLLEGDELVCAEDHLSSEQMAQNVSFTLFGVDRTEELQAAFDAMEECLSATATTTS